MKQENLIISLISIERRNITLKNSPRKTESWIEMGEEILF